MLHLTLTNLAFSTWHLMQNALYQAAHTQHSLQAMCLLQQQDMTIQLTADTTSSYSHTDTPTLTALDSCTWEQSCMYLHLGLHFDSFLGVLSDNAEAANALTVQAHVLGIGLATAHGVTILHEDVDGLCISLTVPTSKALQHTALDSFLPSCNITLLPLIHSSVDRLFSSCNTTSLPLIHCFVRSLTLSTIRHASCPRVGYSTVHRVSCRSQQQP